MNTKAKRTGIAIQAVLIATALIGMMMTPALADPGEFWSTMTTPTTAILYGVWGSSGSDVFAVGGDGAIIHYDGTDWSTMTSPATALLRGVWGSSGSDVFATGGSGTILHYNGTDWSTMTSPTTESLFGIMWGSSGSDVFAVGNSGTIVHFDGTEWSLMTSPTTESLWSVFGSSGSDVFAVGNSGTIIHYDGSTDWSTMTSPTTENLWGVWGSSGSDVFAVGTQGTIIHYDGTDWSTMTSPTTESLCSVWGSSGSDAFAGGRNGIIIHYIYPKGTVYFEPSDISASYCETTNVSIWTNTTEATTGGKIVLNYTCCCANITDWTRNTTNFPTGAADIYCGYASLTFASTEERGPGLVHIGDLAIHCCNISRDCVTDLAFVTDECELIGGPPDFADIEPVAWVDGTINCAPLCGDVNEDGEVNIDDVNLLQDYLGYPGYYTINERNADVTGDGEINMGDVILLANYVGHPDDYELKCIGIV